MDLKTYFDFTTAERSALTREQVQALCAVALMQQGIIDPKQPATFDEPMPVVTKVTRYRVLSDRTALAGLYETMEQARRAVDLQPTEGESKYLGGNWRTSLMVEKPRGAILTVEAVEVVTSDEYARTQSALDAWGNLKAATEKAQETYRQARASTDKATADIWKDWHELQARNGRLEEARAKFAEYVRLCNGDEVIARRFLTQLVEKDNREEDSVTDFVQDALGDVGRAYPPRCIEDPQPINAAAS
jgi:hypothetical protein